MSGDFGLGNGFVGGGGYDANAVSRTKVDNYAWRFLGPQDPKDSVSFNKPIDATVVRTAGVNTALTQGTIFSLTANDTVRPGVYNTDAYPVAAILAGSDADGGDVVMMSRGVDYIPFNDIENIPLQSLSAGYVFETSAYDPTKTYTAGTPLTAQTGLVNPNDVTQGFNFDTAGLLTPGTLYADHIIGTVWEGPHPSARNNKCTVITVQALLIPRDARVVPPAP